MMRLPPEEAMVLTEQARIDLDNTDRRHGATRPAGGLAEVNTAWLWDQFPGCHHGS